MKMKLLIAICAEKAEDVPNYIDALTNLGAIVTIVGADCDPEKYDGLLLPGGVDIDPKRYGQEINGSVGINPELDELQFTVLDKFVKAQKPVFGICRGHQLINVYFGGSLIQHLPTSEKHGNASPGDLTHPVISEKGSFIYKLYGENFVVNSSHHQAADCIGDGLEAVLRAEDGTVEASRHTKLPIWSLQWHPERMCFSHKRDDTVDGSKVLEFFLKQCR